MSIHETAASTADRLAATVVVSYAPYRTVVDSWPVLPHARDLHSRQGPPTPPLHCFQAKAMGGLAGHQSPNTAASVAVSSKACVVSVLPLVFSVGVPNRRDALPSLTGSSFNQQTALHSLPAPRAAEGLTLAGKCTCVISFSRVGRRSSILSVRPMLHDTCSHFAC